ncbi:hypothetical protein NEOC65_000107 [Neochlamydia sp. AcF65]|nr:hypothetical protein [Neochlamydia sp. AcF65]
MKRNFRIWVLRRFAWLKFILKKSIIIYPKFFKIYQILGFSFNKFNFVINPPLSKIAA